MVWVCKLPARNNEGHSELLVGVAVDADVLDQGVRLQAGLNLAQRDVLAQLKLDKIFLPVN